MKYANDRSVRFRFLFANYRNILRSFAIATRICILSAVNGKMNSSCRNSFKILSRLRLSVLRAHRPSSSSSTSYPCHFFLATSYLQEAEKHVSHGRTASEASARPTFLHSCGWMFLTSYQKAGSSFRTNTLPWKSCLF